MSHSEDASAPLPLLNGVRVLNAGRGLVAAVTGKLFADLGADVAWPDLAHPDPSGDFHPAYAALRSAERRIDTAKFDAALGSTDILIVGGEDFPGLVRNDRSLIDRASGHDRLIVLHITGYPEDHEDAARPAVEILVQARSGLTYEHYRDRANFMTFQPASYGAALQGAIGALTALIARERGMSGRRVSTSLYQGALAWVTTWAVAERPTPAFHFATPFDPRPLILQCAGGDYIHIVMGSAGSKYRLYQILGIDDPSVQPDDAGLPSRDDPPEKFYGDVDLIAPYVARWDRAALATALAEAGIVAAPVLAPGACWSDPQILHDGLVRELKNGSAIIGAPAGLTMESEGGTAPPLSERPKRPLEGIRVIDFGAFTAGPLASLALSRLGADVIKVEPPSGDPCRNLTRAFNAANRGKRSIALDLKNPAAQEVAARLCASADMVVSNFRTGVSAKLGIDPATLLARHPHLIVLECPAFGSTGPRAREVAFDLVMQAFCGFEVRAGGDGNVPLWNRTFLADYGGGQLGSIALLAALYRRLRMSKGAALDVSLLRAAMFLQSETIRLADGSYAGADMADRGQRGFHPSESLYQAKDGWLALAIRDTDAATALRDLLSVEIDPSNWRNWREADQLAIVEAVAAHPTDTLLQRFAEAGLWAERCRDDMERRTLSDDDLDRAGLIERIADAELGQVSFVGSLVRLSAGPPPIAAAAPENGEHGDAVLREIGYDDTAIGELRANGAVR